MNQHQHPTDPAGKSGKRTSGTPVREIGPESEDRGGPQAPERTLDETAQVPEAPPQDPSPAPPPGPEGTDPAVLGDPDVPMTASLAFRSRTSSRQPIRGPNRRPDLGRNARCPALGPTYRR